MESKQLLQTLEDLREKEMERFKWYLKECKVFSVSDLEKADVLETVDLIKNRFGPKEALKITADTLKEMKKNYVAEELEKKHKQELVTDVKYSFEDPPSARAEWKTINDSHQLTLDLNTVNKYLRLSENNRVVTYTDKKQTYPDHPDRFDHVCQVLCGESVCGRCYWELEWSGDVDISVSYKSIGRKGEGDECRFGSNDQSWSLCCSSSIYLFRHNNIQTLLSVKPISRRIRVFVDPGAGTLSFFSVSRNTMSLIHTEQTTFTQPLYPGFAVFYSQSSVKLLTRL